MVIVTRKGRALWKIERKAEARARWEADRYAEVCELLGDRLSVERIEAGYRCFLAYHRASLSLPALDFDGAAD